MTTKPQSSTELGVDTNFPLSETLRLLVEWAQHLHISHECDCDGWEQRSFLIEAAQRYRAEIAQSLPPASAAPVVDETFDVKWRRPNTAEVLECHDLTAALLVFRIRAAIRMSGGVELLSVVPKEVGAGISEPSVSNHVFTCSACSRQWSVDSRDALECFFVGLCYWCIRQHQLTKADIDSHLRSLLPAAATAAPQTQYEDPLKWLGYAKTELETHAAWWYGMPEPHCRARAEQALNMVSDLEVVINSPAAPVEQSDDGFPCYCRCHVQVTVRQDSCIHCNSYLAYPPANEEAR